MSAPSVVEDVFLVALEKNTPEERAAYLDTVCKDDPGLRRRVERLLAAHPKAGSFLESPTVPPREETAAYVPIGEQIGAIIVGRYKLVEKIGEGGMGTVWVAQQTEPVKRVVAVKLIKAGMDSKAVLARFEAERQALALMDHPNIARVLDGGATSGEPGGVSPGRPFFVMELVKGVPITHFCDARRLTPHQRLELFIPVCQAIQHAHQKGVIHRDIKPSNVLIALYDDRPVPKVIDFGVAKATGQTLTDKSLMTGFGAVVGTPEYMSPEQASLNNLDIDTRSDVYSLGVLLYELLAGSPPFHSEELKKAGLIEMLRVVCEEEPPRPSIKLSTANKRASISADRGTEPKKLTGLLRNELDWIVMKALEKDRARRYETVNGFAADVQRYLAGETVQAHPPSAAYRLRKFARKHRVVLTTVAAFTGLLIAAAVVSSWLAVKARQAEALANEKRIEADEYAKQAGYNAGRLHVALEHARWTAASLQVDLDLAEIRSDPRVGILRLARTLQGLPENNPLETHEELGEFVAAAVLAAGQDYAPLLPPITHEGQSVNRIQVSPDHQTLLILGNDYTVLLCEMKSARTIAVLRRGDERVVNCGYSPDGRTVFTDDQASVARLWDMPSGRFRAEIERRPNRYGNLESPGGDRAWNGFVNRDQWDSAVISGSRLLTRRIIQPSLPGGGFAPGLNRPWGGVVRQEGPVELWDTATGKLVARLDRPDRANSQAQFLNGGRWVTTVEAGSTVLACSAEDGRLLAKLEHPSAKVLKVFASPTSRRIATVCQDQARQSTSLRFWDASTWRAEPVTSDGHFLNSHCQFLTEDLFTSSYHVLGAEDWLGSVYRYGEAKPIADFRGIGPNLQHNGDLAQLDYGRLVDLRTWQRLHPPAGRKFHANLNRFALDGRFVLASIGNESVLIDTQTEKYLPMRGLQNDDAEPALGNLPGFGLVATVNGYGAEIRLLPPAERLNLPPELIELWAQVAVRGELGPEGEFVKWDEPTWEKKRQELAAKPVPFPDFAFPGHVAKDKLHWLRAEFGDAKSDADKLRLARELLRRAEAGGDRNEAVRWRAETKRLEPPVTPPPQSVKP